MGPAPGLEFAPRMIAPSRLPVICENARTAAGYPHERPDTELREPGKCGSLGDGDILDEEDRHTSRIARSASLRASPLHLNLWQHWPQRTQQPATRKACAPQTPRSRCSIL